MANCMKEKPEMPSSEEDKSQFVKNSVLYKEFLAERAEAGSVHAVVICQQDPHAMPLRALCLSFRESDKQPLNVTVLNLLSS